MRSDAEVFAKPNRLLNNLIAGERIGGIEPGQGSTAENKHIFTGKALCRAVSKEPNHYLNGP
jgi:hypothetical protein